MEGAEDPAGGAARDPQALICRTASPRPPAQDGPAVALPAAGSAESSYGGAWATTALLWAGRCGVAADRGRPCRPDSGGAYARLTGVARDRATHAAGSGEPSMTAGDDPLADRDAFTQNLGELRPDLPAPGDVFATLQRVI